MFFTRGGKMVEFKEWLEAVGYRISEGSEFLWNCFGPKAYRLDAWDGEQDGTSFSIVSDTGNQTVYLVEAYDYSKDRAYRLINPLFKSAYYDEAKSRGVDIDSAYDNVKFVDLETKEDWLKKASAIFCRDVYDERVEVPIDFTDEELLTYMKMAHERDMTFNQFVEQALRQYLDEYSRDPEGTKERAKNYYDAS